MDVKVAEVSMWVTAAPAGRFSLKMEVQDCNVVIGSLDIQVRESKLQSLFQKLIQAKIPKLKAQLEAAMKKQILKKGHARQPSDASAPAQSSAAPPSPCVPPSPQPGEAKDGEKTPGTRRSSRLPLPAGSGRARAASVGGISSMGILGLQDVPPLLEHWVSCASLSRRGRMQLKTQPRICQPCEVFLTTELLLWTLPDSFQVQGYMSLYHAQVCVYRSKSWVRGSTSGLRKPSMRRAKCSDEP